MALIRWNPAGDLLNIHSELDRVFDDLVQVERVGPEGLVAERPVAEDVAARQGDVSRRLRDPCCDGRTGAARVHGGSGEIGAARDDSGCRDE